MSVLRPRRSIPEFRINPRFLVAIGALVLVLSGCGQDGESPTGPVGTGEPTTAVAAAALTFWQLSSGTHHTCGLTTENRAYCWGWNYSGQLGEGTTVYARPVPTAVAGTLQFRQISSGSDHTCAVTTDDRAYCWGYGWLGQLGDGAQVNRYTPVQVMGGLAFLRVDAGDRHTCGVTTARKAYCWGTNEYGQLGDGTTTGHTTPRPVVGGLLFRQVAAGGYAHSCGVTTDNRAFCWGFDQYGQLGDSATGWARVRPSHVAGAFQWSQLEVGNLHTCGVTTAGRGFCWGDNANGKLGNGTSSGRRQFPSAVLGGLTFRRISAGMVHTCGETTSNKAYCWGDNFAGGLGDGGGVAQPTPVAVAGGLSIGQMSAGGFHTCGKTTSGVGYCWGDNDKSQLGDGTTSSRPVPTRVAGAM